MGDGYYIPKSSLKGGQYKRTKSIKIYEMEVKKVGLKILFYNTDIERQETLENYLQNNPNAIQYSIRNGGKIVEA